jgi:two-component system, cell cycle sensor histidine kinase and response regulator CckA
MKCGASTYRKKMTSSNKHSELSKANNLNTFATIHSIRKINKILLREKNPTRLVNELSRLISGFSGNSSVWIVLLDKSGRIIQTVEQGCGEHFDRFLDYYKKGNFVNCIQMAHAGEGVATIENRQNECNGCPMQIPFSDAGAVAVRLEYEANLLGYLCATMDADSVKNNDNVQMLQDIASDLSYVLHQIFQKIEPDEISATLEEEINDFKKMPANPANNTGDYLDPVVSVTLPQKAKTALQESEERFRKAFHTSPDSISITRLKDGLYVDINDSFTQITGYSRNDVIGKTSLETKIWSDAAARIELINQLQKHGSVTNLKARFRKKSGKTAIGLMSASISDMNGVPHILSVTRDIDDILKTQQALKESQKRFQLLFEESPIPIWELDVSKVKIMMEDLGKDKIENIDSYLEKHTEIVDDCIRQIKIIDINKAVLDLYASTSKKEFKSKFHQKANKFALEICKKSITNIWEKKTQPHFETPIETFANEKKEIFLKWMAVPGYESTLGRIIIATVDITENKKSIQILQETEALLHEAQRIGRVGSWQKDFNSGELWWSDGAYRLFDYDPQLEQPPSELYASRIHPDDRDRVAGAYKESVKKQKPYDIIFRIQIKNGATRYIKESCETYYNGDNESVQSIGTIQDITQTKIAEDALTQANTQYRHLIEQSNDAIYLLYENKFESINPRFTQIFGYSLAECNEPDFHFMKLVADESKPIIKERMRKFSTGERVDPVYEFSALSKKGQIIKCEASVSRFKYKGGVATQGVIRDIGARKKAEEESRKLLQAVEQSPTAVLITDLEGRIEYANPQFTTMTGFAMEELKGTKPSILQPESSPENILNHILDTITEGNIWGGESQNIRKNGQFFWEKIAISPIFNNSGLITHFLYISEDVTEKKELEEQLRQSQKMEAIGQLAGGVAHDFNNLLTIINGYTEILLTSVKDGNPLYNGIYQIKQAGIRAESLTRQLLAFSRKQIMQPQILDINDLIHNMERMLSRLIGEDIDLSTIYEPNLHRIKVDPGQFEQVILNLAINARDAMPVGGTLTIATRNKFIDENSALLQSNSQPGMYSMLTVSDTGKGMDKQTLERIFEPFYTTKGQGTGLGLSTVYGIIQQSGGMTTVESEEGRGATFKIYFPAIDETSPSKDTLTSMAEEKQSHETILIAEDEDSVRDLATLALQRVGYNVIAAENGIEAIEKLNNYKGEIDLLLTDVIMPQMGGKELADAALITRPNLKVLYMSGYTDDSIVHHGVLERETEFLQKPFTPHRLIRKIRRIISGSEK